jgi:hypothetical protein
MAEDQFIADVPPRGLTSWERDILRALAPQHDPEAMSVHSHCACGCSSISLVPELRPHRLLAEQWSKDLDGVPISFLLFGNEDGTELDELEIQRADSQPLQHQPHPATLTPDPPLGSIVE